MSFLATESYADVKEAAAASFATSSFSVAWEARGRQEDDNSDITAQESTEEAGSGEASRSKDIQHTLVTRWSGLLELIERGRDRVCERTLTIGSDVAVVVGALIAQDISAALSRVESEGVW